MDQFFQRNARHLLLIKFSIDENRVCVENCLSDNEGVNYRMRPFLYALNKLCEIIKMPNIQFLISMQDGIGASQSMPIFVMAKKRDSKNLILIPDYDSLLEGYQVLTYRDILAYQFPWDKKKEKLMWRGSTAQRSLDGRTGILSSDNLHMFSRVILCELSSRFPGNIDAKFTYVAQNKEPIPYLDRFLGDWVSYEMQLKYKYQILIDGNVCPYSSSGWKLFTNSLIFKPESEWIQWYYGALIPSLHYVSVKSNLEDLIEKINWAKENDEVAEKIAQNARKFAIQNLTVKSDLIYIYHLLKEYSQCVFIDD